MKPAELHLKEILWRSRAPGIALAVLTVLDALIGGSFAALLQVGGWTALDQRINNVYQASFSIFIAVGLVWLYFWNKDKRMVWALLILFAGYVEDSFFYVLVPLVNPLISILTKGETYHPPAGGLFPETISGWIGWVGRMILGQNFTLDLPLVFALNVFALALVYVVLKNRPASGG